MREIRSLEEMRTYSLKAKMRGKTIALVPTMGYLHEGHLSLVEEANKRADLVVVSIFVNPIQFSPGEDFKRYPRDVKRDKRHLKHFEVDVLFLPETRKVFPDGFKTYVEVDGLSKKLCGRTRPTHFRGVTTVVTKLFNQVMPDVAFFGDKDYQQQLIIKQLVKDLDLPIEIVSLPTVREYDGVAMSSRNQYLSPKEREMSLMLYKALCQAKGEIEAGERDLRKILFRMRALIGTEPSIRLDYCLIVDPETLEEVKKIKGRMLVALASLIGKARLIDNLIVEV